MLNEQRRQQLFAKLGRGTLFNTIEERNQWIKEEQRLKFKFVKKNFMLILSISQYSKISTLVLQGEEKLHYISEGMKNQRLEVEKITYLESLKQLNHEKQTLLLEQRRLQMSRRYSYLWY